jgi:hypothetical protein
MSKKCWPRFRVRNSTVGGQKNWDTQNFLHLYQAFNCQDKVKIKLTFTITGYYQSDSPWKTSTLRCQMQAQMPTFYIDCRKMFVSHVVFLSYVIIP